MDGLAETASRPGGRPTVALVLTGGGLAVGAMLCGVSGLAFAIGVYLPLATMAALNLARL